MFDNEGDADVNLGILHTEATAPATVHGGFIHAIDQDPHGVSDAVTAAVDRVVNGGAERFHSVRNGLDALPAEPGLVGIHDAVRPLVEVETIRRCYEAAEAFGGAIPLVPVKDTIRRIGEGGSAPLDRAELRAVQTPQVFDLPALRDAYAVEYAPHFTDDATVWEASGRPVAPVEGDLHNIKLTTPEDLLSAEAFLALRRDAAE